MGSMLGIFLLFFIVIFFVESHNNNAISDADMQSALMPQELNPAFISDADKPWRSELPLPRTRRESDLVPPNTDAVFQLRSYTRIIACVILSISALVEFGVFLFETFY